MAEQHPHIDTLCLTAGRNPKNGEARQLPIVQSTTFKYESTEQMARLFDLAESGYFYSRLANPTCDAVAAKITKLEGGAAGLLTSSGQAANFFAVFNICNAGDHFIATNGIYGGTFNLFAVTLKKMGIDCTFVSLDATDEEIQAAFRPNTKLVFSETVTNPGCRVCDIERWAGFAHANGVPLVVDNTFPTPVNCRPIEWGADIVTHSTTKYLDGQGRCVGGCVIDSGKFDWSAHADKFPGLTQPDESYHGLTYTETFGEVAYLVKIIAQLQRDFGCCQSPQNAYLLNNGIETLHLRIERHVENARRVVDFLKNNPQVAWVNYAGDKDSQDYTLAQKYLPKGSCGVLCFGLKDKSREAAVRFLDALRLINIATHVADAKSCVLHPASHTHRQLSDEQLEAAGIPVDLIRLSIGIENADDLVADLEQALQQF